MNNKTICPLPWLHFSAHLDSTMRICCNTDSHGFVLDNYNKTIKLSEVNSIDEYFNLNFFKEIRMKMLNGEKPEICNKCYKVEESGGESVRNLYLKRYSNNKLFLKSLLLTGNDGTIPARVQSLDFSLSNKCNLKCVMCSPDASYILKDDFEKLEIPYDKEFTEGAHINWEQENLFTKIIPQIGTTLQDFLTTGGEPFLNKTHYNIVKMIVDGGKSKNVNLSYHTNCTVKNDRLFELWREFKSVRVHFSIDAFDKLDEYIRFGTKWENVEKNVKTIMGIENTLNEVHSCIQVLNIFNLTELYDWLKKFRGKMPILPFHIWMHNPSWLHINILPNNLKERAIDKLEIYFKKNEDLYDYDCNTRSDQIISYLKRSLNEKQDEKNLEVFKKRIKKIESLRGLPPIEKMVPELKELFN